MDFASTNAIILYAASFLTAGLSAAIGMGGGIALLAVVATVVPTSAIVPLHAVLLTGAGIQRSILLWKDINWKISLQLILGIVFGVAIGANLNINIPENTFKLLLGAFLITIIWAPRLNLPFTIPMAISGFLHGCIATAFGAGGIIQSIMSKLNVTKHELVGTIAVTISALNIFKIAMFITLGFIFMDYLEVIVIALICSTAGTYMGKLLLNKTPEQLFKYMFKAVITALALRLVIVSLLPYFQ